MMNDTDLSKISLILLCAVMVIAVYLLPTIIAFRRKHHYKWVIFGINAVFGFTGIGFLAAFVWAVWPRQTAFLDLVANDPTTNSAEVSHKILRQMGTNVRVSDEASFVQSEQKATESGTPMPSFCSNCGKPLPSRVNFCPSCGMALRDDRSISHVNQSSG